MSSFTGDDAVSARPPAAPTNSFVRFNKVDIEQSIGRRFEQQACQYPGRLAIKDHDHAITYDALNGMANCVARAILSHQQATVETVAVVANNDVLTFAAILGTLKAGKIIVPLDSSLSKSRAKFILEDTDTQILLANDKNLSLAEEWVGSNQLLVNIQRLGSERSDANLGLDVPASTHAHILYTSGSMGQPKGVLDTHRNVLHHVMRVTNGSHISAMDRMAVLRPPCSSGGLLNAFSALLNGTSLYLVNLREVGLVGLTDVLIDEKITYLHCGATPFRHFARLLTGREQFRDLRLIKLSSGMVSKADVDLFKQCFPDSILLHVLSSTEALTYRMHFIDKNTEVSDAALPVGYHVEDMNVFVIDEDGKDLGCDSVGEIAVRSEYLFERYWKQPALTNAVFIPDETGADCRTFRTGDFGRMRQDGRLEYIGRKDSQLKVRGHTVQPEEVELALLRIPGIAQGVALGMPDFQGDTRIVAYVVPNENQTLTVTYIRNCLKERLPEYMIPSAFVILSALPIKPSGKLDRDALPLPGLARPPLTEPLVEPRTPVQRAIAGIWSDALGISEIGVRDNFFDLGGDSIVASKVLAAMNKTFPGALSVPEFFQYPTVEDIAQLLRAKELNAVQID